MDYNGVLERYLNDCERYADIINGTMFRGRQVVAAGDLEDRNSKTTGKEENPDGTKYQRLRNRTLYRDLVKRVACGVNFAVVGIENQSEVNYLMPLRVMRYDAAEYGRQAAEVARKVRKRKGISRAEFLSGFEKEGRLRPCITLVLFYGEKWDGSRELHELLDFSDIPEELRKYVANYPVNIINVREFENTDVFRTDVRLVFDFIKNSGDRKKLKELVENNEEYSRMDEDAYDVVALYAKAEGLLGRKKYITEGGKVNMCKALEDWSREERTLGRAEGHAEGRKEERADILKLVSAMFGAGESPEAVKRMAEDKDFFEVMRNKYLCTII